VKFSLNQDTSKSADNNLYTVHTSLHTRNTSCGARLLSLLWNHLSGSEAVKLASAMAADRLITSATIMWRIPRLCGVVRHTNGLVTKPYSVTMGRRTMQCSHRKAVFSQQYAVLSSQGLAIARIPQLRTQIIPNWHRVLIHVGLKNYLGYHAIMAYNTIGMLNRIAISRCSQCGASIPNSGPGKRMAGLVFKLSSHTGECAPSCLGA
jgi:hypothetical protein